MKITAQAKDFAKGLEWAIKQIARNSTSAYVSFVVDTNGQASLTHRNSRSYFYAPFTVQNPDEAEFSVGIPATAVSALVKAMKNQQEISIEYKEKSASLRFSSQTLKMNIPLLEGRVHHQPKVLSLGTLDGQEFFSAMNNLAVLCDRNEDSGALSTVSVKLNADTVSIAATDRFIFGQINIPFVNAGSFSQEFLVPYDMSSLIKSNVSMVASSVELILEEKTGKLGYRFPDGTESVFSVMNETPLNTSPIYKNAKKVDKYRVVLSTGQVKEKQALLHSLSSTNISANDSFVSLSVADGNVTLSDSRKSNVFVLEDSRVNECEEKQSVSISRALLQKLVQAIPSKRFSFNFDTTDPKISMAVMYPVDASDKDLSSTMFVASLNTR